MNGAVEGGVKPEGAWTAEQTVSYMLEKLDAGHFVRSSIFLCRPPWV